MALTTSTAALALALGGQAVAGECTTAADGVVRCNGDFDDGLAFDVEDLALVLGGDAPSSVNAAPGTDGIHARVRDDATITNAGWIQASGADGIDVRTRRGDITVHNAIDGVIEVTPGLGLSIGIHAYAAQGDVTIDNAGTISVDGGDSVNFAFGILARSFGNTSVTNSGHVSVYSRSTGAFGMQAGGDSTTLVNEGLIEVASLYGGATGISGNGSIENRGDIDASGLTAVGIAAFGDDPVVVSNTGHIRAEGADANGIDAFSFGDVMVENAGDISSLGSVFAAIGIHAETYYGDVTATNAGDISVQGTGEARAMGVYVESFYGNLWFANEGTLTAVADGVDARSYGVVASSEAGGVAIDNAGTIRADVGIRIDRHAGTAEIANSGAIIADTAIFALGDTTLRNSGSIAGAILMQGRLYNDGMINGRITMGAGNDAVWNSGTWNVLGGTSDFGNGDDRIDNAPGATLHLVDGRIWLGLGDEGNRFENRGMIVVSGQGMVHMGLGADQASPNALPLLNDGAISFLDGSADDALAVTGDFDGQGALYFDIDRGTGAADTLHVDGNVAGASTQVVNIAYGGAPTQLVSEAAEVVFVSGNANAGNFVGGEVLGFTADNFLDLDVAVTLSSRADGSSVFSAAVQVAGLNDAGVLAASVAPGVHDLIGASIGTRRQRMGVEPVRSGEHVAFGPWLRVYGSDGNVAPVASGFSAARDFGFAQENRGREVGFNVAFGAGFDAGLLAGTADGRQALVGAAGGDRIDLAYSGLYATWRRTGGYVDASMRWMDFDAHPVGAAGDWRTDGHARAFNLEAGYTGWNPAGIALVPQFQYTRATVSGISPMSGTLVDFTAEGGNAERVRVGLDASRAFAGGRHRARWTPYGAVGVVREMGGGSTYAVGGNAAFSGASRNQGTHVLLEAGLGMQAGGLSATVGLHWADGGSIDNTTGGQVVLRYAW